MTDDERVKRDAKIVKAWNEGVNKKTLGERFGIGYNMVKPILDAAQERGVYVRPEPRGGRSSW